MQVKAQLNNLRVAPRKVRLVANLVKGMKVDAALDQLRFLNKKSAEPVADLLSSAIANAVHNFSLDRANLKIKEAVVEQGITLKRFMPRAYGRANVIRKKMSHVRIILEEIVPTTAKAKAVKEAKAEKAPVESKEKKPSAFAKATEDKAAKKTAVKAKK